MKPPVRLLIGGLSLISCVAFPVGAQDTQTGSRLLPRQVFNIRRDQDPALTLAVTHRLMGCAVVQHPTASKRFLDATTTEEAAKWRRALFSNELSCRNITDSVTSATDVRANTLEDIGRGIIAEAVLSHNGVLPRLVAEPSKAQYSSPWQGVSGRAPAVEEMAVCVASTNPDGIEALLKTEPQSRDEASDLSALSPSLGSCLVSNAKLTANRQSLRAALAEALYHRAAAIENGAPPSQVNPQQTASVDKSTSVVGNK